MNLLRFWKARLVFVIVPIILLGQTPLRATIHGISIGNFFFSPTNTTVSPGDTVRWTLTSGFHTTTSDAGAPKTWDSGNMTMSGQTFDVVFTTGDGPGPFPYHCSIHPLTMKDTIFIAQASYVCGDANGDTFANISDAVYLVQFIFNNGSEPVPVLGSGDANCDSFANISDAVALVQFIFNNGNAPGDPLPLGAGDCVNDPPCDCLIPGCP